MRHPTNYEKYPEEVKKVTDFLMEVRSKYPDAKVDNDGEITYANANDGTDFDWTCNNRLCEFGWGTEDGDVWAFKCLVHSDGEAAVYCYPHGEMQPVETIRKVILSEQETSSLRRIMLESCDKKELYDVTLDHIRWTEK